MKNITLAIAVTLASLGSAQAANLVDNGDFVSGATGWESPSGSFGTSALTFSGGVATLHPGLANMSEVSVAQNIGDDGFTVGDSYLLRFDATGAGQVLLMSRDYNLCTTSGLLSCSATQTFGAGVNQFQFTVTDGDYFSTHLKFKVTGDGFATLDNISITAVPEPGTYAMMLAGLGALGWVARRRKAG